MNIFWCIFLRKYKYEYIQVYQKLVKLNTNTIIPTLEIFEFLRVWSFFKNCNP